MKNLSQIVKYVFITPWCPANKLEWYNIIMLSAHVSGIANSAVSFLGVVTSLNNNESSSIYFSANVSTLHIAVLVLGNLFWARYKYKSSINGWLSNLPVFPSQLQINVFLSEHFFVLLLTFCLYQPVKVRNVVLAWLYSLDFPILVVPGNMTYQAFGIFLI